MSERELSMYVVGLDHPNPDKSKSNRRFEAALCAPGDPVELRREPNNKHDEHAVAVFSGRGVQLGYLRSELAAWISGKLTVDECQAVFQEHGGSVAMIRVRFGGGAPTLPPPRPARQIEDDFTPDPDGPEWGA